MSITFKSAGHVVATFCKAIFAKAPQVIADIENTKKVVDLVLPQVPGVGPIATEGADLAYAALGEIGQVILLGGDAAKAKLNDAGLDLSVLHAIEAAVKGVAGLGSFLSALQPKKA
jgi:hypothetical protein